MKILNLRPQDQKKVIAVLAVFVVILGAYLSGIIYYSYHFLPRTSINGIDVSGMNLRSATEALKDSVPFITVVQKNREGTVTFTQDLELKDLDRQISCDPAYDLRKQNALSWFLPRDTRLKCHKFSGTYDINRVRSLTEKLFCMKEENVRKPQDAELLIEDGKVVLKPENDASYIRASEVERLVREYLEACFTGCDEDVLDLSPYYETAAIRQDDPSFDEKKAAIEKVLNKTVTVRIEDEDLILKGNELSALLTTAESKAIIDEEKVDDYIYGLSEEYGISRPAIKKALAAALLSEKDETVETEFPKDTKTLIEVSLSEQKLYYIEDDVVTMTSDIVSANPDFGSITPTGEFEIRRKVRNATLSSATYVEYVDYWIGWDETGRVYGFHDASWRDAFGGDIYKTDPSHGCVNMPTPKVARLFEMAEIGTKVIIRE